MIPIKKTFFAIVLNMSLLSLLMVGIQNSTTRRKVNFLILETIKLPTSFIIGVSFIGGSITGSFLKSD